MFGFRADTSLFPLITEEGLSKREIAARACNHHELALTAYSTYPDVMRWVSAVYFVQPEGQDVCKIGFAVNPFERLPALQTANWLKLKLRAMFWYPCINLAQSHEYQALALGKTEGVRLQGEWVDLDHMEAIGLFLCAARGNYRFTDTHGLIHKWLPELRRQREAGEEDFYERTKVRIAAATEK